eukprot:6436776-Prymnesium_polylepis.2
MNVYPAQRRERGAHTPTRILPRLAAARPRPHSSLRHRTGTYGVGRIASSTSSSVPSRAVRIA